MSKMPELLSLQLFTRSEEFVAASCRAQLNQDGNERERELDNDFGRSSAVKFQNEACIRQDMEAGNIASHCRLLALLITGILIGQILRRVRTFVLARESLVS